MRDRYRKRQGLDPDGTTWNGKKARREQSRAAHKKAVPLGSASWVGKTIDMEPGSGGGAWFAAKNRGFDYQKGRFRPAPPLFKPHPLQGLVLLLSAVGILIPAYREAKRAGWFPDRTPEIAFPATGTVTVSNGVNNQATLKAADYLLQAKVLYSDSDAGGSGGGLGSMFPGGLGFKQKVKSSQTMLTLIEVKTGIQQAIATGAARKKDLSILGGGLLTNAGVGALGGAYTSTDMGKITSIAMLDAFVKLTKQAQARLPQPSAPSAGSTPVAPVSPAPAMTAPRQ